MKLPASIFAAAALLALGTAATWMSRVPSGPVKPTGEVPAADGWEAVTVIDGLACPWSVAWLPTGEALITEKDGGKVLGCHILGAGAAEMIQLVAIPMGMGASKADFDRAIALHPSAAEELVTFKAPTYAYRNGQKVSG